MKRLLVIFALLASISSYDASAWGRHGHDAIAYIAELNLNPRTKEIVENYLDGKSIVYVASWPDQIRFIHEYAHIYPSHSHIALLDENLKVLPRGASDALNMSMDIIESLSDGKYTQLPDSLVAEKIKILVHFIGDIHCPVHHSVRGRKESFRVISNGQKMSFHHYIDSMPSIIHDWSYMEYGHQLSRFSPAKVQDVTSGDLPSWVEKTARMALPVWDMVEPDGELGKPYEYEVMPLFDEIIASAGYRLAFVLNSIFK